MMQDLHTGWPRKKIWGGGGDTIRDQTPKQVNKRPPVPPPPPLIFVVSMERPRSLVIGHQAK